MSPNSKVDPITMLGDAKRVCDTLVSVRKCCDFVRIQSSIPSLSTQHSCSLAHRHLCTRSFRHLYLNSPNHQPLLPQYPLPVPQIPPLTSLPTHNLSSSLSALPQHPPPIRTRSTPQCTNPHSIRRHHTIPSQGMHLQEQRSTHRYKHNPHNHWQRRQCRRRPRCLRRRQGSTKGRGRMRKRSD